MDQPPSDPGQPVAGGWIERLAGELSGDGAAAVSLSPVALRALLRLARDVAHATERVNAPLSTYLAGRYVAARMAEGCAEADAVEEVLAVVRRLLDGAGSPA
ncbi:MAG TPA: DUF6457 domain-containing protein [Candidatus Dormibacteraeota bacterium]|jgi:hypothetical protein